MDTTPTWSHDVAKLLDPESNTDWRLLAKRLSYSNDDLKAWAAHHSPCMSMLVEWFATHNSSEATRAVYIVLKDMGRDDAATVVADAMKAAGEFLARFLIAFVSFLACNFWLFLHFLAFIFKMKNYKM